VKEEVLSGYEWNRRYLYVHGRDIARLKNNSRAKLGVIGDIQG